MNQHTPQQRSAQAALVSRFNAFPPLARRVLLVLSEQGRLTVEQLVNHAGTAALGHASALTDAGFVECITERYLLTPAGAKLVDAFNAAASGSAEGDA